MDFFTKHDWVANPSQEEIDLNYTEENLHGLFLKCAVCGGIKATELFFNFIDNEYVICGSCLERIRTLRIQILKENRLKDSLPKE